MLEEAAESESSSVRQLARRAASVSPDATAILLEIAVASEGALANLALLVLGELDHDEVDGLIDARLARAGVAEEEMLRLLTAKTFVHDDPEAVLGDLAAHGDPLEVLSRITGRFWDLLSPAEMAVMWIERFAPLPPEEKIPVLEMFAQISRADFPMIARVEAGAGSAEVDRFLAEAMKDFPSGDALAALKELALSPDVAARLAAEASLAALHESHPDLLADAGGGALACDGPLHGGYRATDPVSGQQGVVLARRDLSDQTLVFCVALLDPAEQGFLDLWGNAGFSDDEFAQMMDSLNAPEEEASAWVYRREDPEALLGLLRQAEAATRAAHKSLPPGFNLWSAIWK